MSATSDHANTPEPAATRALKLDFALAIAVLAAVPSIIFAAITPDFGGQRIFFVLLAAIAATVGAVRQGLPRISGLLSVVLAVALTIGALLLID